MNDLDKITLIETLVNKGETIRIGLNENKNNSNKKYVLFSCLSQHIYADTIDELFVILDEYYRDIRNWERER